MARRAALHRLAFFNRARFATRMEEVLAEAPILIPLTLHFHGAIPDTGLDAQEVAAVADGMARAISILVQRAADGDTHHVLRLTEVRPGSATFKFLLEAAAAAQTALPVILENHFSIKQVGDILGGVIKVLTHLKGKPPAEVIRQGGTNNVAVTNNSGEVIVVNNPTFYLAGDAPLQDQIAKAMRPLRKPDREVELVGDRVEMRAESDQYQAIATRPVGAELTPTVNTIEATLRVRAPTLEGDGAWRFGWGKNTITAKVVDPDFMEKVRAGDEEFAAGDVLRVRMRIEEQPKGRSVNKKHFIEEVISKERDR